MYFDTHCHYDFKQFDDDRDELLGKVLPDFGVDYVLNAGCNIKTSRAGIGLAQKYSYVYASVGFHPHNAKELKEGDISRLGDMAKDAKVVAIGEIGLDYHYDFSPCDVQRDVFISQLDLAQQLGLPVIVHCREADDDVYEILLTRKMSVGGVLHCFSGDAELAKKYVAMGFYIGVGGVVTYKNAAKLHKVVESVPINSLLIETDCPYLSPEPRRSKRNDSQNLRYISEKIGNILEIPFEKVAEATKQNALKLFKISV